MQRSGSTLQYQIAAAIVEDQGLGTRVPWHSPAHHESVIAELGTGPGYKVFKSHVFSPAIEREFKNRNAAALYSFRDIRDVVCSLQAKNRCAYGPEQLAGLVADLLGQHRLWTSQAKVCVWKYEDMILDLEAEIRKIGEFLGASLEEEAIGRYGKQFSLSSQTAYIQSIPASDLVYVNDNAVFDRKTLLHRNHISDGSPGRYKKELSPAQTRVIEGLAQKWLTEHGYLTPPVA
jgi:hypothetical protein